MVSGSTLVGRPSVSRMSGLGGQRPVSMAEAAEAPAEGERPRLRWRRNLDSAGNAPQVRCMTICPRSHGLHFACLYIASHMTHHLLIPIGSAGTLLLAAAGSPATLRLVADSLSQVCPITDCLAILLDAFRLSCGAVAV